MSKKRLIIIVVVFVLACFCAKTYVFDHKTQPIPSIPHHEKYEQYEEGPSSPYELQKIDPVIEELLDAHNAERKRQGKLELADDLCEAAQQHAEWMAKHNNMTHKGFQQRIPSGYSGAGENIAMGQDSVEEVVNAWMHSSGHRANILNSSFNCVGFGVAESNNGTKYWCTMLGNKQWTLMDSLQNHPIINYFKELWNHFLKRQPDNTQPSK